MQTYTLYIIVFGSSNVDFKLCMQWLYVLILLALIIVSIRAILRDFSSYF